MTHTWKEVAALAARALELEGAEREAFLRDQFERDPELAARAEAVIRAGLVDDGFLEPLVGEAGSEPLLGAGASIGSFRLAERIGSGSMGTVFAAEQDAPRRRVALKVMNDGLVTPAHRARFDHEVEALGVLNHPNIAQIYQAGIHEDATGPTPRQLPYFAMEYVEGATTLLAYAERRRLDVAARLRLCLRVCEAVHFGHQKGIIHRDLKPENLLVDANGSPKIIDFGVAGTTDTASVWRTMRTQTREIVGTLPYMSPEQARGEPADVRSDVYGLGAVLYELLTGCLPIAVDAADFLTSARRIVETPPIRPTKHVPHMSRDMEAVLLKALEKEPSQRYASAEALAADLGRLLRGEAVEARAPTALDPWRSFARRHRVAFGAAAAVALVLVASAIVSLRFAIDSRRAETLARRRTEEVEQQRERTSTLFENALSRGIRVTQDVLPRIHGLPGGAAVAVDLMEATVADLEGLEAASEGNPVVTIALAQAHLGLGDLYGSPVVASLGNAEAAEAAYLRALELVEGQFEGPRRAKAIRIAARALRRRTELRQLAGRAEEVPRDLQRALALLDSVRDEASLEDIARIRFELGLVHHLLSVNAKAQGDLPLAEHHAREALDRLEQFAEDPHRHLPDAERHVAAKAYWLGVVLLGREGIEDARSAFERALAITKGMPETRQQRMDTALYAFALGSAERRLGAFERADEHLSSSRDGFRALRLEDPDDPRVLPHLIGVTLEWVYAGDRQAGSPERATTGEGRRRAQLSADQLRALAPESKILASYANRLEDFARDD